MFDYVPVLGRHRFGVEMHIIEKTIVRGGDADRCADVIERRVEKQFQLAVDLVVSGIVVFVVLGNVIVASHLYVSAVLQTEATRERNFLVLEQVLDKVPLVREQRRIVRLDKLLRAPGVTSLTFPGGAQRNDVIIGANQALVQIYQCLVLRRRQLLLISADEFQQAIRQYSGA